MSKVSSIAVNTKTGQTRPVVVSYKMAENAVMDGVDRCSGPCRCKVEPDGECDKGWQSRLITVGLI